VVTTSDRTDGRTNGTEDSLTLTLSDSENILITMLSAIKDKCL